MYEHINSAIIRISTANKFGKRRKIDFCIRSVTVNSIEDFFTNRKFTKPETVHFTTYIYVYIFT